MTLLNTSILGAQELIKPDTASARMSLPYQAFPIQDPRTGKSIRPDELLTLGDGRKMKAEEYYAKLSKEDNDNYATWLPPQDQTGDGRTKLNEKFGY